MSGMFFETQCKRDYWYRIKKSTPTWQNLTSQLISTFLLTIV